MANFTFVSVPAFGHFNPTLPIIAELTRRGHDVTVINSGEFGTAVAEVGARFLPFPVEFSSKQLAELLGNGNLGRAIVFSREAAMVLVPWLNELFARERPDCLVYDAQAIYGHISGKMMRLPTVSIFPYPVIEATRHLLGWRTSLAALRQNGPHLWKMLSTRFAIQRNFGTDTFPTTRPRFQARGDITLLLTIPELQRPDAYRDETMIYVGPSIDERVRQVPFPFEALDGRPLVYVSLGTLATGDSAFYRTCLRAFAPTNAQFVMSIGQRFSQGDLGEIPSNFIVRNYVPQLEILKRAAAFVSHCGFTGFQEALWYGVPMVGIPQQIEQLMNARLSAERGATIALEDHFLGRQVNENELRIALETILGEPSYGRAAKTFQPGLHASGGFRQAAQELENFVARRQVRPAA